ncbi:hypothetical protein [Ferrimonas marina]|uniref:Outer membrane insertion C-terminal signal n=1 Tax=Ferrimonas marina TaxID=299255 RepID=A0A1M5X3M6_9GAMM|nr:hypothetical protein [Ferrimonas marina]SHH94148.1 hypothetical protein SAMN02745129_3178 [Ferrimonas marina]
MKYLSMAALGATALLATTAAEARFEVGFGYDQGLGVTAQLDNKYNFFLGNDGISADYLFKRGTVPDVEDVPMSWYVGGGAFVGWDDGIGARLPLGLELHFAPRWEAFLQVVPNLDFDGGAEFGLHAGLGVRYAF